MGTRADGQRAPSPTRPGPEASSHRRLFAGRSRDLRQLAGRDHRRRVEKHGRPGTREAGGSLSDRQGPHPPGPGREEVSGKVHPDRRQYRQRSGDSPGGRQEELAPTRNGKIVDATTAARRARMRTRKQELDGEIVMPAQDEDIRIYHTPFQDIEQVAALSVGSAQECSPTSHTARRSYRRFPTSPRSPSRSSWTAAYGSLLGPVFAERSRAEARRAPDLPLGHFICVGRGRLPGPPASGDEPMEACPGLLQGGLGGNGDCGRTCCGSTTRRRTGTLGSSR